MAFYETDYLEKIGTIQQRLHESEKKRLELERELAAYCRSDKRVAQIKNAKLCSYLKEISEREQQAKIRNFEFLKDIQRIEMHTEVLAPYSSTLHQKKEKKLPGPSPNSPTVHLTKGLYQPATIFMGRETSSEIPAIMPSFQPIHSLSNQHLPSSQHVDHKMLSKLKFTAHGAVTLACHVEDQTYPNDYTNRSSPGKRGRLVPPPSSNPQLLKDSIPLQISDLTESHVIHVPEEGVLPQHSAQLNERKSPGPQSTDLNISANVEIVKGCYPDAGEAVPLMALPGSRNESQNNAEGGMSTIAISRLTLPNVENDIADTESDFSISLSEDEECSVSPEDGGDTGLSADKNDAVRRPELSITKIERLIVHKRGRAGTPVQSSQSRSPFTTPAENLILEGFVHLLKSIEGRLHQGENCLQLYKTSSVTKEKRDHLISLCHRKARLNEEDLEACGAVVLHQLQRLSWSMSKGCLLPEEIVSSDWTTIDEGKIRSCLSPDSAMLWEYWYKHVVILGDCHVLSTDEIAEIFTPLLVAENCSDINKAKALLKTLLPQASEGSLSVQSNESSCSLPSILNDSGEIKPAKPAQWSYSTAIGKQGPQSGEEDSKEESLLESIPIRETKAYQLLKQSAVQQRRPDSDEEDEVSDLELSVLTNEKHIDTVKNEEVLESETSSASHKRPHFRKEDKKKTISTVKSKAFWGESDDSNTDIEAVLCPQTHSTNNDDFDDFYD
ncbi:centrosomal protein kizuna isoform X2 [Amia ocellicauda]|uniref:centrosomal protein kizuna isoform X2 n=1 Tax=Amia ocellicauda TaxID=2972642 RepID=UPI0034642AD8